MLLSTNRVQLFATAALLCRTIRGDGFQFQNAEGTSRTAIGFDPDAVNTLAAGPVPKVKFLSYDILDHNATVAEPSPITTVTKSRQRRIVGPTDDRVLWNSVDYPYSAMGRLAWSEGYYCSATMIGRRLISTARHCTPSNGESWGTARFQPDYWEGSERLGGASVLTIFYLNNGWENEFECSACFQQNDWVVMLLDTPLGDNVGYLGVKALSAATQLNKAMFFNFGYPYDIGGLQHPYRQEGITVKSANECSTTAPGPLETDTDTSPGQSGGPLWLLEDGQRYQYGTLSCGSDGLDGRTGFGGGSSFVSTVVSLRQSYP